MTDVTLSLSNWPPVVGQQSRLVGEDDGLDAIPEVELGKDVGDVGLHGRLPDEQPLADLRVR